MQTPHTLDAVQMSSHEREHAKAHMQRAEFIIDQAALGASTVSSVFAALTTYCRSALKALFRQRRQVLRA